MHCCFDFMFAVLATRPMIEGVQEVSTADIVQLLTEYMRRCVLSFLRIKIYHIARNLLISMGVAAWHNLLIGIGISTPQNEKTLVGMASYLAPTVIDNAVADLKGFNLTAGLKSPNITKKLNSIAGGGGLAQTSSPQKRKHNSGLSVESQVSSGLERKMNRNDPVIPIPVQISALQALEALLTVVSPVCFKEWGCVGA
eukprot:Gb_24486 [translate_table: standard]